MDRFDHIFVITMKPLQWKPDLVHNSIVSCHTLTHFTIARKHGYLEMVCLSTLSTDFDVDRKLDKLVAPRWSDQFSHSADRDIVRTTSHSSSKAVAFSNE